METSNYYINGVGLLSPQATFDASVFLSQPREYTANVLACVTPEFKNYINPIQLRRLSRMLRIGLTAATICVRDSQKETPDGIITATGYGFLDDTAKFLTEMLTQGEKQITPTHFMQSTYNALGGLVALSLKCSGYNTTYVSKGFAFETALLDAMMQIHRRDHLNFLVGAYDETDKVQYAVNSKAGHYKLESISSLRLFESETIGSLQGEGAAFFSISGTQSASTWCRITDLRMIYRPEEEELNAAVGDFLRSNGLSFDDIDVVVNGASGDIRHDRTINSTVSKNFPGAVHLKFKHLCGEFCTASSFAVWMAARILKEQKIPEIARVNTAHRPNFGTVMIINQYMGRNYSMMMLSRS